MRRADAKERLQHKKAIEAKSWCVSASVQCDFGSQIILASQPVQGGLHLACEIGPFNFELPGQLLAVLVKSDLFGKIHENSYVELATGFDNQRSYLHLFASVANIDSRRTLCLDTQFCWFCTRFPDCEKSCKWNCKYLHNNMHVAGWQSCKHFETHRLSSAEGWVHDALRLHNDR